jgi:hypothetical protein
LPNRCGCSCRCQSTIKTTCREDKKKKNRQPMSYD